MIGAALLVIVRENEFEKLAQQLTRLCIHGASNVGYWCIYAAANRVRVLNDVL